MSCLWPRRSMRGAPGTDIYGVADVAGAAPAVRPHPHADRLDRSTGCHEPTKCRSPSMSSDTFKTMFDNLAAACGHMLRGPYGRGLDPGRGISVLYGAPPATIDLAMVSFQNHDCERPLFDP